MSPTYKERLLEQILAEARRGNDLIERLVKALEPKSPLAGGGPWPQPSPTYPPHWPMPGAPPYQPPITWGGVGVMDCETTATPRIVDSAPKMQFSQTSCTCEATTAHRGPNGEARVGWPDNLGPLKSTAPTVMGTPVERSDNVARYISPAPFTEKPVKDGKRRGASHA